MGPMGPHGAPWGPMGALWGPMGPPWGPRGSLGPILWLDPIPVRAIHRLHGYERGNVVTNVATWLRTWQLPENRIDTTTTQRAPSHGALPSRPTSCDLEALKSPIQNGIVARSKLV